MSMKLHHFRKKTKDAIAARALMRNNIVATPAVINSLNRYLRSLNLQARVNSGAMTNTEALIEFEKAVHFFARKLHTFMDNKITRAPKELDQTDLSNPVNMQIALQNPLSYASQLMNDTAQEIINAMNIEAATNEQIMLQNAETTTPTETETPVSEEKESQNHESELIASILLFDESGPNAAKEAIESAFFKETGIKTDFHAAKEAEEDSVDHHASQKILKPEFKDYHTEDDEKK